MSSSFQVQHLLLNRMKFHSIIAIALAGTILSSCQGNCPSKDYPQVFAHRGCWFEDFIPENSLDGVEMAARFGYPTTECDVRYTADSVLVLMHDSTINRTMRNASDYSVIEEPVRWADCTFEELRNNYVLASGDPARRAPIPTFREYLNKCKECGIVPILHCDIVEAYELAQEVLGNDWIAFNANYDVMLKVREMNPEVRVFYAIDKMPGDRTPENVMARLEAIGGKTGISTMNRNDLNAEMIAALAANGYTTQSSIFPTPHDMKVIHDGVTILLSDFAWFQTEGRQPMSRLVKRGSSKKAGEIVNSSWDTLEYGAMTISVGCKGDFELTVNGSRVYEIHHEDFDTELLGFRMHDVAPSIELKSLVDGSTLKKLEVEIYKL